MDLSASPSVGSEWGHPGDTPPPPRDGHPSGTGNPINGCPTGQAPPGTGTPQGRAPPRDGHPQELAPPRVMGTP